MEIFNNFYHAERKPSTINILNEIMKLLACHKIQNHNLFTIWTFRSSVCKKEFFLNMNRRFCLEYDRDKLSIFFYTNFLLSFPNSTYPILFNHFIFCSPKAYILSTSSSFESEFASKTKILFFQTFSRRINDTQKLQ